MYKEDFTGQTFGNRIVIRNYCIEEDWIKINKIPPTIPTKHRLTKCLNCVMESPALMKNLILHPPKKCCFCSNIGNHSNIITNTNSWTTYNNYAVINVIYKNKVISAQIDIEDYQKTKEKIWRVSKKKNKYYLISGSKAKNNVIYLHRFILNEEPQKGYEIDHIDGNSLNNRKNNLRIITRQENIQNTKERIDSQLGIRGVSPDGRGKYIVDFSFNKNRVYSKPWSTIEEAVWCRKCLEDYYGLQMLINNPKAKFYFTLPKDKQEKIKQYILSKISRK